MLGVSMVLTLSGLYFSKFYECGYSLDCYWLFTRVGDPLLYGGLALSVVFALLLLIPSGFAVWKKFAIWFVPLAVLLFIFYPEPGAWDFLSPMPEQLFQWVSIFYVAVSAILIGYAHLTKQR